MRRFETGANRDQNTNKVDYMGHISPLVTWRYGQYMNECRNLPDGTRRDADNWKRGMPFHVWLESLVRHMEDVKLIADGHYDVATTPDIEKALCAVLFNAQGLLYQILVDNRAKQLPQTVLQTEQNTNSQAFEVASTTRESL